MLFISRLRHPVIFGLLCGQVILLVSVPIILLYNVALMEFEPKETFSVYYVLWGMLWIAGLGAGVAGVLVNMRKLFHSVVIPTRNFSSMESLTENEASQLSTWMQTSECQANEADRLWSSK
jgi:hypothetical protein